MRAPLGAPLRALPGTRPGHCLRDRSGVAAIEFAVCSALLCLIVGATLSLGFAFHLKMQTLSAISEAAHLVYSNAPESGELGDLGALVEARLRERLGETASAEVRPIGGAGTHRFCVLDGAPGFRDVGTSLVACPDGSQAGRFVAIAVSRPLPVLFPAPPGLALPERIEDSVTVRLP